MSVEFLQFLFSGLTVPTDHIGLRIESIHISEIRSGEWVPMN
jgi:hypothetical protein